MITLNDLTKEDKIVHLHLGHFVPIYSTDENPPMYQALVIVEAQEYMIVYAEDSFGIGHKLYLEKNTPVLVPGGMYIKLREYDLSHTLVKLLYYEIFNPRDANLIIDVLATWIPASSTLEWEVIKFLTPDKTEVLQSSYS